MNFWAFIPGKRSQKIYVTRKNGDWKKMDNEGKLNFMKQKQFVWVKKKFLLPGETCENYNIYKASEHGPLY